jgi:hypothetical protein
VVADDGESRVDGTRRRNKSCGRSDECRIGFHRMPHASGDVPDEDRCPSAQYLSGAGHPVPIHYPQELAGWKTHER